MDGYLQERKEQEAMLHRETKFIVIICLILSFTSCSKYKQYDSKEIKETRATCMHVSEELLGKEYWKVYNSAVDSIESWIDNGIGNFSYWRSLINYQLDSVLCVNREQNKVIMSILLPYIGEQGTAEQIEYFYGVKINNQWYFYGGPTLVLPREFYQEDVHTPLSFAKLQQIATAHIYRGYLKQGKKGQWEINERFFDQIIPSKRTLEIYNLKDEEEYVKFMVEINWSSDIEATFKKYREN